MRTIGSKITFSVILLLLITAVTLGFFSYTNSSKALIDQVETRLEEKVESTVTYIEEHFEKSFIELKAVAMHENVRSAQMEEQLAYLTDFSESSDQYLTFGIVTANGESHYIDGSVADLSDRTYIQQALEGRHAMSDVIISRVTGEPVLMMATPIDTETGEKQALLARIDGYYLSNITDGITMGESGNTFLINEVGTVLAHKNRDFVKEQRNFLQEAEESGKESNQSILVREMLANGNGMMDYTNDAGRQLVAYTRMENGWSAATIVSENEMLEPLDQLRNQVIVLSFVILVVAAIITYFISRSISQPIRELVGMGNEIAQGDFSRDVAERTLRRHDEVGILGETFQSIMDNMRHIVGDVNNATNSVNQASNDMLRQSEHMNNLSKRVGEAMHEMEDSSATQVHMANDSAREMETMADGVTDVARIASTLANNTDHISSQVIEGNEALQYSFTQMNEIEGATDSVTAVIRQLHEQAQQISSITNMITQISEQTNLLALNASIEAARAGEAGAGFAIVADEVRELSHQTADSADKIHTLVQEIQQSTTGGVRAAEAATSNVVKGTKTLDNLEEKFTEIVQSIENMTGEIEEMTAISEEMAAGTQEVAASLEEMSGAAESSSELVGRVTSASDEQNETIATMSHSIANMNELIQALQQTMSKFKV
ncbi:methyl-accepting chemotaxis protein [Savagea faecisuis]|uniref:Methyl-accepting chemotaxis protein n=1 Tax=Savagea faecisuis TaxID=1274803 RepID=A0ABW3H0J0_9BACL